MHFNTTDALSMRKIRFTAAIAVAMLAGCGETVQNAPKPGDDIAVPAFTWRVRTQEQIASEYAGAGKDPGQGQEVAAYIGRLNGATIITTKPPRYVDDKIACDLGHEVMHAALGDYHAHKEAR